MHLLLPQKPKTPVIVKPKSPIIAALLNFLVPGLGYQYVGSKRYTFRMGIMIATALALFSPIMRFDKGIDPAFLVSAFIMVVVFAIDAYEDARETHRVVAMQRVPVKDDEA